VSHKSHKSHKSDKSDKAGKTESGAVATGATMSRGAVTALGVGGMMGAGLYTLLGLAAATSGGLLPLAFLIAGVVAAFSVYSYAKLGSAFPSRGGAAVHLREAFGEGLAAGGLNVFQYAAYIIATALYAAGFAEYVAALAGNTGESLRRIVGVAVVVVFAIVNLVSSKLVGRSETAIVAIEMVVLVGFVAFAVPHLDPGRMAQTAPGGGLGVLSAAALLYVTYQDFGVAATAAPLATASAVNATCSYRRTSVSTWPTRARSPNRRPVLAGSFVFEAVYRRRSQTRVNY
jgi:amino acid transporter